MALLHQVDEREDHDPDDVDEVPVQTRHLQPQRVLRPQWPRYMSNQRNSSQITPMVTCAPWNPVRTKNVEPNRFVCSVRPSW
jgi:hypothetical protein